MNPLNVAPAITRADLDEAGLLLTPRALRRIHCEADGLPQGARLRVRLGPTRQPDELLLRSGERVGVAAGRRN